MINEENLNKLYEKVINEDNLTTKELNNLGFTSKDLTNLINNGIITRIKRGLYSFNDVENLYLYAKKLFKNYESEQYIKGLKKCIEINPKHSKSNFQLFFDCIKKDDYENAMKYYENLDFSKTHYQKDFNLYLYLLNSITKLSDNLLKKAESLALEDIILCDDDMRYKDKDAQNIIRNTIYQKKFTLALVLINAYSNHYKEFLIPDNLTKILLKKAAKEKKQRRLELIDLFKQKKYEEVVMSLENNEDKLNKLDIYILKITKLILQIENENFIIKPTQHNTTDVFKALDNNDFELALNLSAMYNTKSKIDCENDLFYLAIKEICEIINKQKQEKKVITFSDILNALINNNTEQAYSYLTKYMKSINKSEYEFLIVNLIKLSLLENDKAFTKPMITLSYMQKNDYSFDLSEYIQAFYISISQNKYSEARIYLDIISKANKNNNLLTEELFKVIEQSERIIVEKQCAIKQEEPIKHQSPKIDIEKPKTNFKKTENPKKTIISDNEENYIEKKYQELLLNKGFILLKPMNSLRRKKIHEIVSKYDDMDSFSIGKDEERQIVLRYSPHINEFLDVQALINEAKQSYKEKKYNKTIYTNYRLLEISKKPRATIFAALGLSYLKIKQIDKAIECLTIATKIDDIKNKFDFTELILDLKNNLDPEDRKPIIKMNNNELFQNDEWYGINCIEELNSLILDNNLDFMSACLEFGLNVEQIDIVKLIYAKYYFAEGNIKKAEEFLKSYEQSTTKTEKTLKIYTEIRKNKKLYINKKEMDKKLELSLTLKP